MARQSLASTLMNIESSEPRVELGETPPPPPTPRPSGLGASLRADYEALRNDVQQAQELAADFQGQLAGKSNELAGLKLMLEKTQRDLAHMQAGIAQLREERHRLANELMKAAAFEQRLVRTSAERDRLTLEVESLRQAMEAQAETWKKESRDKDWQLSRVVERLEITEKELTDFRNIEVSAPSATPAEVTKALTLLDRKLDHLTKLVTGQTSPKGDSHKLPRPSEEAAEFIAISFES
jgi:chromosome segregation ATPase